MKEPKIQFQFESYKQNIAAYLREKEIEMARGNLKHLQMLESISNEELLQRWAWKSTILGAIFSFLIAPLMLSVLHIFLSHLLIKLLWAVVEICMALSIAMLCAAMYFTVYKHPK